MKRLLYLICLFFAVLLAGCKKDVSTLRLIDRAELLLKTNPDSSHLLLDSIHIPDNLTDKELARWCMLSGKVADTLYTDLPYTFQLERAQKHYLSHGTPEEQVRITLYLGRAYVDDRQYDKAMHTYLSALDMALKAKADNLSGYICSYMGDLYDFQRADILGKDKYAEAADYFERANNRRSQAFALRDVGRMYVHMDSFDRSLECLQKAKQMIIQVGDSSDRSSIYNGLGNVYAMKGNNELAKQHLQESISLSEFDNSPSYLALADIYVEQNNSDSAYAALRQAAMPTFNEYIPTDILYVYYKLEKARGDNRKAFEYVDQYIGAADSIFKEKSKANIVEVEKKYNQLKILFENSELRKDKQWYFILFLVSVSVCLLLFATYQIRIGRKNRKIYDQKMMIEQKNNNLLRQQVELKNKEFKLQNLQQKLTDNLYAVEQSERIKQEYESKRQEIEEQKKQIILQQNELLMASPIAKKVVKMASSVVAGAKTSLLTDKDWEKIYSMVNLIYPDIEDKLLHAHLSPTELQDCYLSLLGQDANSRAILLNINLDSVNKRMQRVRRRLGIIGENFDLATYLINHL